MNLLNDYEHILMWNAFLKLIYYMLIYYMRL